MKTEHIPYLLTIANTGSINKASVKLNYPVQKLCNIMTNVENEFGTQLFIRSRSGVTLTEQGVIFIEHLKEVQSIFVKMRHQLGVIEGQRQFVGNEKALEGKISLSSVPIMNDGFYVSAFKEFSLRYPNIRLDLQNHYVDDILDNLSGAENNVGIVIKIKEENSRLESKLLQHPSLVAYPLFRRTLAVVCRKDSPFIRSNQKSISLKVLHNVPFVACSVDNKETEATLMQQIRPSQIKYHTTVKELFYELLNQGQCFSVIGVDNLQQREYLGHFPDLVVIPLRESVYSEDTVLVDGSVELSAVVKCFINFLFEYREYWVHRHYYLDCSGCNRPNF